MITKINNRIWEMHQVKNQARTPHFFSAGATRFFNSRYPQTGIEHDGKIYFITSEQFDWKSPRLYTIRYLDMETGEVETLGEFQAYDTKGKAQRAVNKIVNS